MWVQCSVLVATLRPTRTPVIRCEENGEREQDRTECDPISDSVEKALSVSPPRQQADQSAPAKYKAT
jgi:hypothetical protein